MWPNADGTLNVTTGTVNTSTATAINIDGPAGHLSRHNAYKRHLRWWDGERYLHTGHERQLHRERRRYQHCARRQQHWRHHLQQVRRRRQQHPGHWRVPQQRDEHHAAAHDH